MKHGKKDIMLNMNGEAGFAIFSVSKYFSFGKGSVLKSKIIDRKPFQQR